MGRSRSVLRQLQNGFARLIRVVSPPGADEDEESRHRASLPAMITLFILAATLIYVVLFPLLAPELLGRLYLVLPTFLVLGVCFVLLRRKQIELTSWILVAGIWFVLNFSALESGGVSAPGYSGNLVVVLMAGLLLGRRASLAFAALSLVSGLGMIAAEQMNALPPFSTTTSAASIWLAQAVFFVFAAALLQLAINTIQRSLERARQELAERKLAEGALHESKERLRLLTEASFEGILIHDQTKIVDVNRALSAITGYREDELVGMNGLDFILPEDRKNVWRNMLLGSEEPVEVHAGRKDQRIVPIEVRARAIPGRNDGLRIVALRDISERIRAEEQIRLQARQAQTLAEISHLLAEAGPDYARVLDTVVTQVSQLVGDASEIRLLSADGQNLECVAIYHPDAEIARRYRELVQNVPRASDSGLSARVLQSGAPVRAVYTSREESRDAAPPQYRAFADQFPTVYARLLVPLRAQGRMHGVLALWRFSPERPYSLEDQLFVQNLADRAALAITNARLYTALQKELNERQRAEEQIANQLRQLTALHTIDNAITATLDLPTILITILAQVTTQLNVHAADILLLNPVSQTLEFANGVGFKTKAVEHSKLHLGNGFAGRAVLDRRLVSLNDLARRSGEFERDEIAQVESFQTYFVMPILAKGEIHGALELFHRAPLDPDADWFNLLRTFATQTAIAVDNMSLFNNLRRSNIELSLAYDSTLEGWTRALDLRDKETEGHTRRVTELTVRLARAMGFTESELAHVRRGALLHDIGKIGIPDSILHKPGPLTEDEIQTMQKHPQYAYEMLAPIAYLRPSLDIPYCHHEHWDGTGYPRGLRAQQIPLAARIFAVIDVWDAVSSDRPYRAAWGKTTALEYIRSLRGQHLDPQVVDRFLEMHIELEGHPSE